jgi:hypothetical protein
MPPANLPNVGPQNFWNPACAEFVLEAYSRIRIRGRQIVPEHMIEARRSANLILGDYSNRGPNLWKIGDADVALALLPGVAEYQLPIDTSDLLDCYLRTFTPATTSSNIGNALTPLTDFMGNPLVSQPYGDVLIAQPSSQTLSSTAGSQLINFNWPSHNLEAGYPIFWGCPISIGGLVLPTFSIVSSVKDSNNVVLMAPTVALETQTNQGATPLFWTTAGSSTVTGILPNHGLVVGAQFPVQIPTTVGGLTLSGLYTVLSVIPNQSGQPSSQFTFEGPGIASATQAIFENGGQLPVTPQAPDAFPTDVFLWPISRNDYAMLPLKDAPGNPTSYWFNRTSPPTLRTWPVAPNLGVPPLATGPWLGFVGYRMRDVAVFNPGSGQTPDLPRRLYQAFVAELCAALSEKYAPALFAEKAQLAAAAWERASDEDREKTNFHLGADMTAFFN